MIAVDTSVIIAVLLEEDIWPRCVECLNDNPTRIISAGTLTETFIVAARRGVADKVLLFLADFPMQVIPVDHNTAYRCGEAYDRWGKGQHPADLNLADTFAYDLAKTLDIPLLYIGNDFAQTDIRSAL